MLNEREEDTGREQRSTKWETREEATENLRSRREERFYLEERERDRGGRRGSGRRRVNKHWRNYPQSNRGRNERRRSRYTEKLF